jgi:oligopeptide transport system substrate-binding protein
MNCIRSVVIPLCALALAGGAGCGKRQTRVDAGDRDQILHIGCLDEPADLDPQIVKGVTEHHIIMGLIEGLVTEDPKDLHPVPGVAETWDVSPDGLVYSFHLRKNARWSNGDPVTAHDFLKSYRRILAPSLAADYAYMHYPVKNAEAFYKGEVKNFDEVGYKVIDDHTFQITLAAPTPYFLSLLCHTSWFPVHLPTIEKHGKPYERGNRWTRPENYVGNGPFNLAEWKISDKAIGTRLACG